MNDSDAEKKERKKKDFHAALLFSASVLLSLFFPLPLISVE
jgi:hypothetical protein